MTRQFRLLFGACIGLLIFSTCGTDEIPPPVIMSYFPAEAVDDYLPEGYTARVVFPTDNQRSIWVKGSNDLDRVRLRNAGEWTSLEPPYYSATLRAPDVDSVFVEFGDRENEVAANTGMWVYPVSGDQVDRTDDFSFLVYGCFQPFDIVDSTGEAVVRVTQDHVDSKFRNRFREVALQVPFSYFIRADETHASGDDMDLATERASRPTLQGILTASPTMVIGTGDQIYVDAGYDTGGDDSPISAWTVGRNPKPRMLPAAFTQHLDRLYGFFADFRTMEDVFARLPLVSAWDDHEIRDGWGSQGDEYADSLTGPQYIDSLLAPYFTEARAAYVEQQLVTAPPPPHLAKETTGTDLHLAFEANGIPVFVFDLRSDRNIHAQQVVGPAQMQAFAQWLDGVPEGKEAVIVSSVPMFWQTTQLFQELVKIKAELRDDIADAWDEKHNIAQRDAIFELMVKARTERDVRFIICSGDVHVAAMNEVWYQPTLNDGSKGTPQVLAYEVVSSGLSHKGLSTQSFAGKLQKMTSREGTVVEELRVPGVEHNEQTYSLRVRMLIAAAKLNFANIERQNGELAVSIFVQDKEKLMQLRLPIDWRKPYREKNFEMGRVKDQAEAATYVVKGNNIEQRVLLPGER